MTLLKLFFFFLGCFPIILFSAPADTKCVQLYYDRVPSVSPHYHFGRIHTLYLQNLISHFPDVQQYIIPIESYKKGQLNQCFASIYLGTYYNNPIPTAFLEDFLTTTNNVLWAGYNIWELSPQTLEKVWGVKFQGLSKLDLDHLDSKNRPSFFKYYHYLGERFVKYGEFDLKLPTQFNAAFEITLLDFSKANEVKIEPIAWAEHSFTHEKVPYILRDKNHWYIADSPFSFATERDRYLIMADLLFDILEEKPKYNGKRPALVRLEDIHPLVPLWQLYKYYDLFQQNNIPFVLSVIPIFSDPWRVIISTSQQRFVPLTSKPMFAEFLNQAQSHLGSVVFHGVTHQYGKYKNPFNCVSGDDFEFWDRPKNRPLELDTPSFVISRLESGLALFNQVGITPVAWLTPHYQASPLDYLLFAKLFTWNIGRTIYFPIVPLNLPRFPKNLTMDRAGSLPDGMRLNYLKDTSASFPEGILPSGQFFPFEIYGDYFDQRLVPENLGNVQPYMTEEVLAPQSIEEILENARRNLVLRDQWASFFVHPFLLQRYMDEGLGFFPGDVTQLEKLIRGISALGYEFIDLKTWVRTQPLRKRPTPIEVYLEP